MTVLPEGAEAEAVPDTPQRIRVLIVDDHDLFREGLRQLIQTDDAIEVVGEAATGEEAIARVRELRPDVVLMDISMPGLDGIQATEQIVRQFPATHVVMLTMYGNDEYREHAVHAGAKGYLVKSVRPEELFHAIRLAAANGASGTLVSTTTLAPEPAAPQPDAAVPPVPPLAPPTAALAPDASPVRAEDHAGPLLDVDERLALLEERLRRLEAQLQRVSSAPVSPPIPQQPPATPEASPAPDRARATMSDASPAAAEPQPWRARTTWHPAASAQTPTRPAIRRGARRLLITIGAAVAALVVLAGTTLMVARFGFPEGARASGGLVAAGLLLAAAAGALSRPVERRLLGHLVLGAGLLTGVLSLVVSARVDAWLPTTAGLAGGAALALAAGVVGLRARSELAAGLGLAAALVIPASLGLTLVPATAVYAGGLLLWTAVLALTQQWVWLPLLSLALLGPQIALWAMRAGSTSLALGLVTGFWVAHLLAAVGEELRAAPRRPVAWSILLVIVSTGLAAWAGHALLDTGTVVLDRGLFLLALAGVTGAAGLALLRACGDRHPVGLAASAAGLAALAGAFASALDGPLLVAGWSALALVLAWVYDERGHGYAGLAAAVLGALVTGHLVVVAYPPGQLLAGQELATPFSSPESATLAVVLAAYALAGYFVRSPRARAGLAAVALLLAVYALPFELSGLVLTAGWASLFVLAVAIERRTSLGVAQWRGQPGGMPPVSLLVVPMVAAGGLALLHAFSESLAPDRVGLLLLPTGSPSGEPVVTGAILIAAGLAAGRLARNVRARQIAITAAVLLAAYLLPSQLPDAPFVLSWVALAVALYCVLRRGCT